MRTSPMKSLYCAHESPASETGGKLTFERGVMIEAFSKAQTALRHVEPPGQVVQHEAAAFAGRKGRNGGVNGLPVDREIVHAGH